MGNWQPINTAPKDATVLVQNEELNGEPVRARYAGMGTWIEVREEGSSGGSILPTHWKTLGCGV
jgi:hypothetical protein